MVRSKDKNTFLLNYLSFFFFSFSIPLFPTRLPPPAHLSGTRERGIRGCSQTVTVPLCPFFFLTPSPAPPGALPVLQLLSGKLAPVRASLHSLQFLQEIPTCSGMGSPMGCSVDICCSRLWGNACSTMVLSMAAGESLLWSLQHLLPPPSFTLVLARLLLTLFTSHLTTLHCFTLFSNVFSLGYHQRGWGAWLCSVVGWLEAAGSGAGPPRPHLAEVPAAPHHQCLST